MVEIRFNQLVLNKQAQWGRNITYREISDGANVSLSTLVQLRKGESKRISLDVLNSLCNFFECQSVADILVYIPNGRPASEGE